MKNFPVLALLFLLTVSSAIAQAPNRCSYIPPRQADNWLFFQNAGIRFSDAGVSVNNPAVNNMPAGKGSATISDADGNLILYTDGMRVWNSSNNLINFGPNLSGDLGSTQSSLIVPRPGTPQMFYIFTTDIIYPASFGQTKGFNYSRVDMSINNNYGAVADHNVNLLAESSEMLTGVKHGNGNDFWVLTHGLGSNTFYAYLVISTGVEETAVQSSGGSVLSNDYNLRENLGAMKISPKGDKVAFASFGKGTLELFTFDNQSGRVGSSPLILNPPLTGANQGPYYVEFSPDGTKLYVTVANLSTGRDNHLYQYDIAVGGNFVEINLAPDEADVSALQLGRDGKIYVSRYQRSMLGVIENPNRPGTACNYNQDGIDLTPKKVLNGLPNFIQSFFDIPPVDYDTKCEGDATAFDILNESNIYQVSWNFGDDGNQTPGTGLNPTHVFSRPDDFTVTMTETFNGQDFITTFIVHIDSLPPKSFLPPDYRYIFPGSTIPLDAGADMFSYLWQDGSNNRYFDVSQEGLFTVEYEDIRCCKNSDSLQIIALDIKLPNAFTPNGDNLNDIFKAIGPTEGIEDYTLTIQNRWGQMLWEAANFEDGWDGKFNGSPLPSGSYAWNMSFNVKGNITDIGKIKYRGSVILLR